MGDDIREIIVVGGLAGGVDAAHTVQIARLVGRRRACHGINARAMRAANAGRPVVAATFNGRCVIADHP